MTASALRALGILALLATQACVLGKRNSGPPDPTNPTKLGSSRAPTRDNRGGFGPKSVYGKEPPTRLVARDGTSCVVSKKKFDSTVLGTAVWCTWFDADR